MRRTGLAAAAFSFVAAWSARADDDPSALLRRADETTYLPATSGPKAIQCAATYVMTNGMRRRMAYTWRAGAEPPSRVDPLIDPGEPQWDAGESDQYVAAIDRLTWKDWRARVAGCEFATPVVDRRAIVVKGVGRAWDLGAGDEIVFRADGPVETYGAAKPGVEAIRVTITYDRVDGLFRPRSALIEGGGGGFMGWSWAQAKDRAFPSRYTMNCGGLGGTFTLADWRVDDDVKPVRGVAGETAAELAADMADADVDVRLRAVARLDQLEEGQAATAAPALLEIVEERAKTPGAKRTPRETLLLRSSLRALSEYCGALGAPGVESFVALLDDSDAATASAAAQCLYAVGPDAASRAASRLIDVLDANPEAVFALARFDPVPPEALPRLEALLAKPWPDKGPEPVRTRWIVEAIAKTGPAAKDAIPALVTLLDAKCDVFRIPTGAFKHGDFREAAADLLATLRPDSVRALQERLARPSVEQSARFAGHAVAAMGDDARIVVDAFVADLPSADVRCRWRAVHALRVIGPPAAVATPQIERMMNEDADAGVRNDAAWALGWIATNDDAAARAVVAAWRDGRVRGDVLDKPSRRTWLDDTMWSFRGTAVAPLVAAVRAMKDDPRGEQAAYLLGHCNEPAVPALEELAADPDATTAVRAIRAMGVVIGDAAMPALIRILETGDDVRAAAAIDALVVNDFPARTAVEKFLAGRGLDGVDVARDRANEALRRLRAK